MTDTSKSILNVRNLSISYGDSHERTRVVHDVSFSVAREKWLPSSAKAVPARRRQHNPFLVFFLDRVGSMRARSI